jgi:hypothetical protein
VRDDEEITNMSDNANNPHQSDFEIESVAHENIMESLWQAGGQGIVSVFLKGRMFRQMESVTNLQDQAQLFEYIINNHVALAIEMEQNPEETFKGKNEYITSCLAELSDIQLSDVSRVREYMAQIVGHLPAELHELVQNRVQLYLNFVLNFFETQKDEFFLTSHIKKALESVQIKDDSSSEDYIQRVLIKVKIYLLLPLLEVLQVLDNKKFVSIANKQ